MPKRSAAEELNLVISTLLVEPERRGAQLPSPTVARLVPIIRAVRNLPRPEFKARLRADLHRRISMTRTTSPTASVESERFRRPNFVNIAPAFFVKNAPRFIDFLVGAFSGDERVRVPRPDGSIMYAEVGIGNSVIEVAEANQEYPQHSMATHLYVPDANDTYAHALAAGATPVYAPTDDHPSGDRWGEAKDPFGNTWYIATRKGQVPGPEGFLTVQPYLHVRDAHEMIPFIEAAFGAQATGLHKSPSGKVLHATIEIFGATFEIDEAEGELQPTPSYLHVYVPDTDDLYAQALAAGAKGLKPPFTAPYGDRTASITDPFGNTWFLATYIG